MIKPVLRAMNEALDVDPDRQTSGPAHLRFPGTLGMTGLALGTWPSTPLFPGHIRFDRVNPWHMALHTPVSQAL